jgi:hypothetical protein
MIILQCKPLCTVLVQAVDPLYSGDARLAHAGLPGVMQQAADSQWDWLKRVTRPALIVAPPSFLADIRASLERFEILNAVALRDGAPIFRWLIGAAMYQGIADRSAESYLRKHGLIRFTDIEAALAREPSCPKLRSYWAFEGCGYRKSAKTCSEPKHLRCCPLPLLLMRKGALNQTAYGLFFFIRDVTGGDIVGWIDYRLAAADQPGAPDRAARMRAAVLEPLQTSPGSVRRCSRWRSPTCFSALIRPVSGGSQPELR